MTKAYNTENATRPGRGKTAPLGSTEIQTGGRSGTIYNNFQNEEYDPRSRVYKDEMEFSEGYKGAADLNAPEKIKKLVEIFDNDPCRGVYMLFGIWPTKQQRELILSVWKDDSRVAVSSCTGAGKTAALTWLTFLLLICKPDCRILITSPSFQQLNRVFNSEARKWLGKAPRIWQDMFSITREKIQLNAKNGVQIANIVTASAENEESLQGGHSDNYVILADEASAINEGVFDILQGTLSTGIGRFVLTSNPTRSSGRFYEIFHKMKEKGDSMWDTIYFDAHDCPHVKDKFIKEIAAMYGEDSDQYRVRILGQFPRTSLAQFISAEYVDRAMEYNLDIREVQMMPKICGVDVARMGDDTTVFVTRQGPKIIDIQKWKNLDGPEVADKLLEYWRIHGHKAVYIDAHGVGSSPYDAAKRLPVSRMSYTLLMYHCHLLGPMSMQTSGHTFGESSRTGCSLIVIYHMIPI